MKHYKKTVFKHIGNSIMIGMFATAIMDLISMALSSQYLIGNISFNVFGRIAGGWFRGKFIYASIADVAPLHHEWFIGFSVHYLIGSVLAFFIILLLERLRPRQRLFPLITLIYGITTVVCPWFLLAPSIGFGFLGVDAPQTAMFFRTSLTNHVTYGLGLSIGCFILFNMGKLPFRYKNSYPHTNMADQIDVSMKRSVQ